MNPRFRTIWMVIAAIWYSVLMAANIRAQTGDITKTDAEITALLRSLQEQYKPSGFKGLAWDGRGRLLEIRIGGTNLTDSNLFLLSQLDSIQSLWMRGGPSKYISADGLASLRKMTNLTELHAACFFAYWKPGVFDEICNLQRLKKLDLYYAFPSSAEKYAELSHLTNLEELHITGATNFGPQQARALTNLTGLKSLSLEIFHGSKGDTNFLGCLGNLTNLQVDFR